ncbi:hypothetical protein ERX46_07325 [Brumimicrobium glaciale]|uniref:DUF3575 domain-containing protein n=1 Tax=Brumimicrobium glaciale TaxID=200475 RepID=A0A4Q4KKB7_9FLAO|nr:hypothetical protein [Brumimicrobium glaciale]RYM33771.1 hypothetical protein ERX46_07325 [Brumimicrobium glaciale]
MILRKKLLVILMFSASFVFGQKADAIDSSKRESQIKHRNSLGSSFFMLGNLLEDAPDYVLLTYGYRLTKKDRLFVEFNTWKYAEPLGTYGNSKEMYPGFIRAFGIGVGYQRFLWRGLFTTIQATPFMKQYHDINDDKTQKGFQLYLQLIAGYRFEFFKKRWYLEPAIALKYWPVDTNYPVDFKLIQKGTPKYIFEPSLNFGFKF